MNRGNLSKPNPTSFAPKPVVLDIPTRFTNASQRTTYTPPKWNTRAGSDAFLAIASKGMGA